MLHTPRLGIPDFHIPSPHPRVQLNKQYLENWSGGDDTHIHTHIPFLDIYSKEIKAFVHTQGLVTHMS